MLSCGWADRLDSASHQRLLRRLRRRGDVPRAASNACEALVQSCAVKIQTSRQKRGVGLTNPTFTDGGAAHAYHVAIQEVPVTSSNGEIEQARQSISSPTKTFVDDTNYAVSKTVSFSADPQQDQRRVKRESRRVQPLGKLNYRTRQRQPRVERQDQVDHLEPVADASRASELERRVEEDPAHTQPAGDPSPLKRIAREAPSESASGPRWRRLRRLCDGIPARSISSTRNKAFLHVLGIPAIAGVFWKFLEVHGRNATRSRSTHMLFTVARALANSAQDALCLLSEDELVADVIRRWRAHENTVLQATDCARRNQAAKLVLLDPQWLAEIL